MNTTLIAPIAESFREVDHLTDRVKRVWEAQCDYLSRGQFAASLRCAQIGKFVATELSFSLPMLIRGQRRPKLYTLVPMTPGCFGTLYRGREMRGGQVIWSEPDTEIHKVTHAGHHSFGLTFTEEIVRSLVTVGHDDEIPARFRSYQVFEPSSHHFVNFATQLRRLCGEVAGGLCAASGFDPAKHQEWLIETMLLPWLPGAKLPRGPLKTRSRQRIVSRAEAIMREHLPNPMPIDAMCRELGVSRRTLFYAFQSEFGMTPLEFEKLLRLSKAYQIFRHTKMTVREVASVVGFPHQGRFAAEFKERYGILPKAAARGKLAAGVLPPLPVPW